MIPNIILKTKKRKNDTLSISHHKKAWKNPMKTFCSSTLAGLLLLCQTAVQAQVDQSSLISTTSSATTSTNFYFARPNEITMVVSVMGFVQRPGRYEISSSIDLMNLISLAGGPTAEGSLSKVKVIRMVKDGEKTVRQDIQADQKALSEFLKEDAKITRREIYLDLEKLSTVRAEDLQLMPGDIVFIDQTPWTTVKDVFGVVGTAAILTLTVTQIIYNSRH